MSITVTSLKNSHFPHASTVSWLKPQEINEVKGKEKTKKGASRHSRILFEIPLVQSCSTYHVAVPLALCTFYRHGRGKPTCIYRTNNSRTIQRPKCTCVVETRGVLASAKTVRLCTCGRANGLLLAGCSLACCTGHISRVPRFFRASLTYKSTGVGHGAYSVAYSGYHIKRSKCESCRLLQLWPNLSEEHQSRVG